MRLTIDESSAVVPVADDWVGGAARCTVSEQRQTTVASSGEDVEGIKMASLAGEGQSSLISRRNARRSQRCPSSAQIRVIREIPSQLPRRRAVYVSPAVVLRGVRWMVCEGGPLITPPGVGANFSIRLRPPRARSLDTAIDSLSPQHQSVGPEVERVADLMNASRSATA